MTTARAQQYLWRKLSSARWEDAWIERLTSVRDRLAITAFPGRKTVRLEAFQLSKAQAEKLASSFGGEVLLQKKEIPLQGPPRAPILVRKKLVIVSQEAERTALTDTYPERQILLIPAGMAFGTGDHATTATCLRLLTDLCADLGTDPWEMLDLGSGSGILAMAGRLLGARKVLAGDFDPAAVRVAKENVKANGLSKISVQKLDVRVWSPPRTWDLVVANLFSGLLVEVAPKIAGSVKIGGHLVFSGILREQETEVLRAFRKHGLKIGPVIRKGKWVTGTATRIK